MKKIITIIMLTLVIIAGGEVMNAKSTKKKAKSVSSVIAKIKLKKGGYATLYSNGKAKFPHGYSGQWKKRGNQVYYLSIDEDEGYKIDIIIGNSIYNIHAGSIGGFNDIYYNSSNKTITFKDFEDNYDEDFLKQYNLSSFTVPIAKFGSIFNKYGTVTWTK